MNDIVIRTGFQAITHNISFDPQKIVKGKALALSNVLRVEELWGLGEFRLLRCSVVRTTSVNEHPYQVQLELDKYRFVTHANCSCICGVSRKCKHIYSLIHYINTDRSSSKTNLEQQWGKPTDAQLGKDMFAKPLVIRDAYKTIKSKYDVRVKPYNLTYADVKLINCPLQQTKLVETFDLIKLFIKAVLKEVISNVINKCVESIVEACAQILINSSDSSDLFSKSVNIVDPDIKKFYEENIKMSEESIIKIFVETVNQSSNKKWFQIRRLRMTASSKVHKVKTRRKKTAEDLVEEFLNTTEKKDVAAIEYGKKNEKKAVEEYITEMNVKVYFVGTFISPREPWLCASPDGLVIEDNLVTKILEVKCPYSCRSKPVFDKLNKVLGVHYLYLDNDEVYLKNTHQYYTQCQTLMFVTGLTQCDFFVWSPKGSCLLTVYRDDTFIKNVIPKLQDFYFEYYLPKIYNEGENNSINKENSQNNL